ncbi:TRAP transporter substrate-binding protein [Ruixingdingia sedimenti]|uniref:TRAP transporter substrate-binding protein n=1 Tax=Ruixingdingia sedimenti TaxID=3073604 RepID=A0ABU1F308_9RHOB|nr:TRAP transporter substrate-binding protein [Xinfangfangia sp. LG-4]MDR5651251.1 TRAP transporter substrate-binding protein [Xinfangfangia sp. LG-4]
MTIRMKLAGLATAVGLALSAAMPAAAETVTIRYSNWLPPGFWLWEDVLMPWIQDIEKVTEGRVKVEVAPKVVGTAANQFDVVRDGLADMSWMVAGYNPGRFPITEFGELPLIHPKAEVLAPVFDTIYREHLEKYEPFKGVYPLSLPTITPLQIVTKNRNIESVDGLKGAKLRSSGTTLTAVMEAIGAVPVLKSAAEAYEMLAAGTIDGQITNLNTIPGFNQLDLLNGVFHIPGGLANAVIIIGINQEKWDSISEADRKAIQEISGAVLAKKVGHHYDLNDEKALETMKAAGYYMGKATDDQLAALREFVKPVEQAWIERAKAAGLENAAEILELYKSETAKAE